MLNKDGVRELAYLVKVDDVTPMNADRLECAHVGGWRCVVGKGEFKKGDVAVYFEVDSKVPDVEPFSSMDFLRSKDFKVKTQKIRGEYSQGLLVSVEAFGWVPQVDGSGWVLEEDGHVFHHVDDESRFLTERLGVTYGVVEDNSRKAEGPDKYKNMAKRHPKAARTLFWRWLYKRNWGKKLLYLFFGGTKKSRKEDKKGWPTHICSKTDVERIQNQLYLLQDKRPYVATEKIDGTSCTVAVERKSFGRLKYYVCSRNVVFDNPDRECYYDTNVYYEMYEKYNLQEKITNMLNDLNLSNLAIQMEIYGHKIQKRDYSTDEHKIAVFHIISNRKKFSMDEVVSLCEKYDLPHVPILDDNYFFPDSIEELQKYVSSEPSKIDGEMKEGIVFYDKETGLTYTKFVSPEFLLKYHQK